MRELSIVLRYAAGQRYLARIRAASRVREVFAVIPAQRLCRCRCRREPTGPREARPDDGLHEPRRMSRGTVVLRDGRAAALQTQSDPEGGIPSGSLEVLGRKQKIGSASAGPAVEGDYADLRWTLVAAIDHLLAH